MLAFTTIVAGLVVTPQGPRTIAVPRPQISAQMLIDPSLADASHISSLAASLTVADAGDYSLPSMVNLAEELRKTLKSEGDEFLEEIFGLFPIIVGGGALAAFGVEYVKNLKVLDAELTDNQVVQLAVVSGGAVAFVVLTKTGILGTVTGLSAKLLLDGWNVIANLVLKGAILKY